MNGFIHQQPDQIDVTQATGCVCLKPPPIRRSKMSDECGRNPGISDLLFTIGGYLPGSNGIELLIN